METKISAQYESAQQALDLLWNKGEKTDYSSMDVETFCDYLNLVYRKCLERLLDESKEIGFYKEQEREKAIMICQFLECIEEIVKNKES